MKILVTGAAGLIGHNVMSMLEQQGHKLKAIDSFSDYSDSMSQDELIYLVNERLEKFLTPVTRLDILHAGSLDDAFRDFEPDTVIHLASYPRQKAVNANPYHACRVMCEGLTNMLESAVAVGVKRFVYISSSMVYGDFKDDVREDAECRPQGQYGIWKLMGEMLVKDYCRKSGMTYTIIRPSAVYGPLDVGDRVIAKFLIKAMRGETITVNGASETLDFTYVEDAARGITDAAQSPAAANCTYNITKSHSKTLLEAAELAVAIAGSGTIDVRDRDADFPSRGALNIDAARRDFGFDPKVDIDEGFQIYYAWLKDSVFWSR
jgi:nucleoside-diphosphate-sugar epimerase